MIKIALKSWGKVFRDRINLRLLKQKLSFGQNWTVDQHVKYRCHLLKMFYEKKSGIDRSIEAFITIHTCTQAYIEMLLYVYIKQNETEENIQNIFSLGYLLVNSFPIVYMNLIVSLLVVNKGKHSSNYVAVELVIITIFFFLICT